MPGYVRGFVEQTIGSRREFVCRVDPITGSQSTFKYVLFGGKYAEVFGPVPHTKGIPDDLAPVTKLAMMGRYPDLLERLSGEDLHEQFRAFEEDIARYKYEPRHMTLEELLAVDWDHTLDEEEWPEASLRLFELVDSAGRDHSEWGPETGQRWHLRLTSADRDRESALRRGDTVEFDGRTVSLRPLSRRELLPDGWFDLLDLLAGTRAGRRESEDVRFVFYWHH